MPKDAPRRTAEPVNDIEGMSQIRVLENDPELVAADPTQQVGGAELPGPAAGRRLQQPVSRRMAFGVVDLLEPVEVERENAQRLTAALCAGDREVEVLVPGTPTGQARQLVGHSLGEQLRLGLHELVGIGRPDDENALHVPTVEQRNHDQ
jgi:hypothetical protein